MTVAFVIVATAAALGYTIGNADAPTTADARVAGAKAKRPSLTRAEVAAWQPGHRRGLAKGRTVGRAAGARAGARRGAAAGQRERARREAAAAESERAIALAEQQTEQQTLTPSAVSPSDPAHPDWPPPGYSECVPGYRYTNEPPGGCVPE